MKAFKFPIAGYALLAFGISFYLLRFSHFIGDDGAYYARVGQNIWAGKGIGANENEFYLIHPPFFPFLIGLFNVILSAAKDLFLDSSAFGLRMTDAGALEFSGHFVSILAFALTVFPLFFLARAIYSEKVAHWACILYATNGYLLVYSNLVMTESLFTLLVLTQWLVLYKLLASDFILRATEGSREENLLFSTSSNNKKALFIGLLGGLAYLTRPEGILFYAAGIACIYFLGEKPFASKNKILFLSLPFFLIFFLCQIGFIYQKTHKIQLSEGVTEIFIKRQLDVSHPGRYLEVKKIYEGLTQNKRRLKMQELKEQFNLTDYLRRDRFALVRSALASIPWRILELNQYLFAGVGFFLIGAGLFTFPWDRKRRLSEFFLLFYLSTFAAQLFGTFFPKRFFHYFPIFLIWMAQGLNIVDDWARKSFSAKTCRALVAGIFLFFTASSIWYVHRVLADYPVPFEYKEMGLWMKQNIRGIEKEKIASRQPAVSFYSGAGILKLPYVDQIDDLVKFLRYQKAKFFVVSDDLDEPYLTAYRPLLDETFSASGLYRKHILDGHRKLILYEIK